MEDITPKVVKIYRNDVLIYQGNDKDTWSKILEPNDLIDTGHGFFIQMTEIKPVYYDEVSLYPKNEN